MEKVWALLWLLPFLMGWVVGWIQGTEPWKRKVKVLKVQVRMLESDLKWAKAKIGVQAIDLERMNQKLVQRSESVMDLPQQRGTYWRLESEKAQKLALDLESQLKSANLRVSELEMALDLEKSKAMGKE